MWCWEIDPDANVVYVNLRGMYGTTAAAHTTSSYVRNAPRFPRYTIMRAINDTIRSVYPDLWTVAKTEITANTAVVTYALPAEVESVLDVTYEQRDASGYWVPIRRYAVDMHANTDTYPTGKTISIFEPVLSNRVINVAYRKIPSTLSTLTTELTASGLDESAKDCLVYGALARLMGTVEPARLSDSSAEARFIDSQQPGTALTAARFYYQLHLQARAEESRRLLDRYQSRPHFTR